MPIPRFAGEQLSFKPPGYLFFGDNLEVLPRWVDDESVDLIYLDPPFNSNKSYNLLFEHRDGTKAAGQIKAFEDTWRWSLESARSYDEIVARGGEPSAMLRGLRAILGTSDMLAYIVMMTPRLIELRRVLKPTGSIFLHCDPTASHYIKVMLDAVMGPGNFLNEIIWRYRKWPTGKYAFQRNHDVVFFYSRSNTKDRVFNQLYMERAPSTLKRFGTSKIVSGHDADGRRVPSKTEDGDSDGVRMDDVWEIGRVAPVKQLYPTEKPLPLLERIIQAASNEGEVVLDPFCGCGTAIEAAHRLGRHWIGVDVTEVAIDVIRTRLDKEFGQIDYVMGGEPGTRDEAEALARLDKHEFQRWACEKIGITQPVKKGADRGIDGNIHDTFDDGTAWRAIVSVKGGKNNVAHLRDLGGTVTREGAYIGILLMLHPPTKSMMREAADAGFTDTGQPRLQLLTVADLFAGKGPDLPAKAAAAPKEERRLRAV